MEDAWARVQGATDPREQTEIVIGEVFAGEFARSALPKLLQLADRWLPDVVVRETCEFASRPGGRERRRPGRPRGCFLALPGYEVDSKARSTACARSTTSRRRSAIALASRYLTLAPRALEHSGRPPYPARARFRARRDARAARCRTGGTARRDPLVYVSFG